MHNTNITLPLYFVSINQTTTMVKKKFPSVQTDLRQVQQFISLTFKIFLHPFLFIYGSQKTMFFCPKY